MDYVHLASALVVFYASIFPFYMSRRIFKVNKAFFIVSTLLGLTFITHGIYRYLASVGNELLTAEFEFISALLVFSLTLYYSYLRSSRHAG